MPENDSTVILIKLIFQPLP